MKFKIISSTKETLPRFNNQSNKDEPTIMVVTKVDFSTDEGEVVHTQEYAHLPEDASLEYFQAQADAMQSDLDNAAATADTQAANKLADDKISQLTPQINESLPNGENQNA